MMPYILLFIIEEAISRQTGARGLDSALARMIEDIGFEHFGQLERGVIHITLAGHNVKCETDLRT